MTTLDPQRYERSITLHCPTCAGTQFEGEPESELRTCVGCRREITLADLRRENHEHIQAHVDEVKAKLVGDVRQSLRNAFRGNKFFKIK